MTHAVPRRRSSELEHGLAGVAAGGAAAVWAQVEEVGGERRLVESGHVAEAARTGPRIVADAPRRPQVGARPATAPEGRRSGAVGGVAPTYFCFSLPPDWSHQPAFALAIHCFANTSRISDSHSECLLATATSRYTSRASRSWSDRKTAV